MDIKRVVPDIKSVHMDQSRSFYAGFLGLTMSMDLGFVMTFVSPTNSTAQITIMRDDGSRLPDVSIEVSDVDAMHARAVENGVTIVYPLTDEPWGVRRFFVADPDGTILNIMSHNLAAISELPAR